MPRLVLTTKPSVMKKIRPFLLFLLAAHSALAQCPTGDIALVSQADVNAFVSAHPGCTTIEGNLNIGDPFTPALSNITSLSGLSAIAAVNGNLTITGNNQLLTLDGLQNLTSLGSLEIGSNPLLTSVGALSAMTPADTSTFDLKIGSNDVLSSLAGLQGIRSARYVSIDNCMSLTDLAALSNLTSLSQGLWLFSNGLTSLHGLENLKYAGGLGISTNRSLVSLDGLKNLTDVGGPVMLQDNDVLANLKGLEKLASAQSLAVGRHDLMTSLEGLSALSSVGYLIVVENPLLTMCAIKPVCEFITSPNAMMSIQDNGDGCNTAEQIENICQTLPVTLADFTAIAEGNTAQLAWTTAEETNSSHFEIQVSTDAKTWLTLGTLASHGDTREVHHYAFTDKSPFRAVNYYRLKMVDRPENSGNGSPREGAFSFSRIRSLDFTTLLAGVHPNPTTDLVQLQGIDLAKVRRIELLGANGKILGDIEPREALSLAGISPGLYFLRIYQKTGSSFTLKIVKI